MFLKARYDTPEVFDPVEETLDVVAFLVKGLGEAVTMLAVDLVGNVRCRALGLDPFPDPVRVVGLVAEQNTAVRQTGQQHGGPLGVVGLAGGEDQFDGQAPRIRERMDLGGQSSSRTAHTMNSVVFFTLAAC